MVAHELRYEQYARVWQLFLRVMAREHTSGAYPYVEACALFLWSMHARVTGSDVPIHSMLGGHKIFKKFPLISKLNFGHFGGNYIWFLTYKSLVFIKNCCLLCLIKTK